MKHTRKIGLLGGTFDPPHLGHSIMALDALEAAELDQVMFLPAAVPPHKRDRVLTEAGDRLAMLNLAVAGQAGFLVSDLEFQRGGVSYTIDTIRQLREMHPEVTWDWIIGADTLPELHTWKEIDQLLDLCELLTVYRPGVDSTTREPSSLRLSSSSAEKATRHWIQGHGIGISSTDIRARVRKGLPIDSLVNPAVAAYIEEHHLYR